ncbi:helix-turn-helix transcriptional regulator [Lysinibacillus sphaericus]|uniref:helix-turn-helix domain-containing protein n=1 Tax=Lysinibacillus sphaericus TaxID=1421 RepID=UPI000569009D|nr:helix-turn-helix transcriptional regulator [Lysinibacillus sphaericus]QTB25000.1 helix-turn-helix transcriptional regulator [Lysinibacillus sphaericus]
MELTAEMLPFIRKCRGLSQFEFAEYSGIPQARLSDIEAKKIPITDHYTGKLFFAIGKLKFNDKDLQRISELVENQNK